MLDRWRARFGWLDTALSVHERVGAVGGGPLSSSIALAGFLSLLLASAGRDVTASDLSAGTVTLLSAAAARLEVPLNTRAADATRLPSPPRSSCTRRTGSRRRFWP